MIFLYMRTILNHGFTLKLLQSEHALEVVHTVRTHYRNKMDDWREATTPDGRICLVTSSFSDNYLLREIISISTNWTVGHRTK